MPFVIAKCTSCGANLEVENTKDAAVCSNCNEPFIVEKGINNYLVNKARKDADTKVDRSDFFIKDGRLLKYTGTKKKVVIPNDVKIIDMLSFENSKITEIIIPGNVKSIEEKAFFKCDTLKTVVLFDGVRSIGNGAFNDCKSLTSITIPNSVTSIGKRAFSGCKSLTLITIPNSVTSIGEYAFSCTSLTSITIPNSVTSIGESAFDGCTSLTSITIPNSVTSIGDSAFNNCTSLISITIPNSVTSIGYSAFENCSNLVDVVICNKRTNIGGSAFLKTPWSIKAEKFLEEQRESQITTDNSCCGCYIATSIYGSYNCPQVWTLRRFRDEILYSTWLGSKFVKFYYATSPTLVKYFGESKIFKMTFTTPLNKLVEYLNKKGLSDLEYEDK